MKNKMSIAGTEKWIAIIVAGNYEYIHRNLLALRDVAVRGRQTENSLNTVQNILDPAKLAVKNDAPYISMTSEQEQGVIKYTMSYTACGNIHESIFFEKLTAVES